MNISRADNSVKCICKRIRSVGGFGLVEVIVSLVIIAILIVPMTQLVPSYFQLFNAADDDAFSQQLAQDKIEYFKSINKIDDLGRSTFPKHLNYKFEVAGSRTDEGHSDVIDPDSDPNLLPAGLYTITVTIYHNVDGQDNKTAELTGEVQVKVK